MCEIATKKLLALGLIEDGIILHGIYESQNYYVSFMIPCFSRGEYTRLDKWPKSSYENNGHFKRSMRPSFKEHIWFRKAVVCDIHPEDLYKLYERRCSKLKRKGVPQKVKISQDEIDSGAFDTYL